MSEKSAATWYDLHIDSSELRLSKEVQFIRQHLSPSHEFVLDIGIDNGARACALAEVGYYVMGLDRDLKIVEDAKIRCGRVDFKIFDYRELYELKGHFDAVIIMRDAFGGYAEEEITEIFSQIYDLLKPKGRLIVSTYNKSFFQQNQGVVHIYHEGQDIEETKYIKDNRLHVSIDYKSVFDIDDYDCLIYDVEDIRDVLTGIGFSEVVICTNYSNEVFPSTNDPMMQFVFEK